ncbi:lipopolysaccharide biosynthesis protein [Pseudomonas helleri]|uniref:lipopolysaccharide biosynthesis protein n=1 Tax=Pseudomonas helleri TaxID=1608996 RepID=UPI0021CA5F5C|nr:oligosaccharide flippase family protein [Pseudomonas helleri]MCU1756087.1 oligosaccharide flippase family protein [Pseudomonas helleri]
MLFLQKITLLKQNKIYRSVGVLVGGTAFSQLLMVLALPLLTRLYTPEDFSILAVYTAILTIISTAACLRFDIAIPLPKQDNTAIQLLILALIFSLTTSLIIAIPILYNPLAIAALLNQPLIAPYLFLIPMGVFLASSYSALQFWATRNKNFKLITKTRISQVILGVGTQLTLGWFGLQSLGLILGQILISGAGIVSLSRYSRKNIAWEKYKLDLNSLKNTFKEFEKFPKISTFETLANNAAIQVPLILIAAIAVSAEAGFLMLAMRAMQVPMSLIGNATAQVYLSKASEEFREGQLPSFTHKILLSLIKVGIAPLLFFCMCAPLIFSIVFGKEWGRAGELVSWMAPWFIIQLITSPISMVMYVRSRQASMLMLTLAGLAIRVGAVSFSAVLMPDYLSEIYALTGAIFYAVCFIVFSRAADLKSAHYLSIFKTLGICLILGTVAAVIAKTLLFPLLS